MKKIFYLILVLPFLIGCDMEVFKMDDTDPSTGLHVKGDGIICSSADVIVDGQKIARNYFYQGEKVEFLFNDVMGLKRKKDLAYPDLSVVVKTKGGEIVTETKNILGDRGYSEFPIKITAYFEAAFDKGAGDEFVATITIKDKKGDGVLTAEMPFKIIPNPNLTVKKNNVDYNMIYLWDDIDKKVITSDFVKPNQYYYIIFNQVEGIEAPVVPMEIIDSKGNTLFSDNNIFDEFTAEETEEAMQQFSAKFTLSQKLNGPITVRCRVNDEASENFVDVETTVRVL